MISFIVKYKSVAPATTVILTGSKVSTAHRFSFGARFDGALDSMGSIGTAGAADSSTGFIFETFQRACTLDYRIEISRIATIPIRLAATHLEATPFSAIAFTAVCGAGTRFLMVASVLMSSKSLFVSPVSKQGEQKATALLDIFVRWATTLRTKCHSWKGGKKKELQLHCDGWIGLQIVVFEIMILYSVACFLFFSASSTSS